jgi:hypothetical protein
MQQTTPSLGSPYPTLPPEIKAVGHERWQGLGGGGVLAPPPPPSSEWSKQPSDVQVTIMGCVRTVSYHIHINILLMFGIKEYIAFSLHENRLIYCL